MVVPTKKCKSAPVWQQALLIVLFDKSQYSPIVNRKFLAMFPRILHWYFQHFHHYKINPFSSTILDSFARTHQLLILYNYPTKPEIEPQTLALACSLNLQLLLSPSGPSCVFCLEANISDVGPTTTTSFGIEVVWCFLPPSLKYSDNKHQYHSSRLLETTSLWPPCLLTSISSNSSP